MDPTLDFLLHPCLPAHDLWTVALSLWFIINRYFLPELGLAISFFKHFLTLIEWLGTVLIISMLKLTKGYWQVPLAPKRKLLSPPLMAHFSTGSYLSDYTGLCTPSRGRWTPSSSRICGGLTRQYFHPWEWVGDQSQPGERRITDLRRGRWLTKGNGGSPCEKQSTWGTQSGEGGSKLAPPPHQEVSAQVCGTYQLLSKIYFRLHLIKLKTAGPPYCFLIALCSGQTINLSPTANPKQIRLMKNWYT